MTTKLIPVLAALLIISAAMGCTQKADPAIAELEAKMEAMQAELDKAKSGNASAEEIAKLETAIAEQEQQAERQRGGRGEGAGRNRQTTAETETTAPSTTTPASAATASNFQMTDTVLTKYNSSSKSVTIPNIRKTARFT
jgi:hypothetical protein